MGRPANIHVLENDAAVADAIGAVLEAERYDVRVYFSTDELFDEGNVKAGETVITSDQVSDLSEKDLANKLAHLPDGVTLIMLTNGKAATPDFMQTDLNHFIHILRKPFSPDHLLQFIRSAAVVTLDDAQTIKHLKLAH